MSGSLRKALGFAGGYSEAFTRDFELHVEAIRSSIADGHLNDAGDWLDWKDSLIFREEQRAIGEKMLDVTRHNVLGYGAFVEKMVSHEERLSDPWTVVAVNFLSDLKSVTDSVDRDFRRARCLLIVKHGVSLIECLNHERVTPRLHEFRKLADTNLAVMPINAAALR